MSERLQNVLRILEGGASDRRRTQMGLGPHPEPPRPSAGGSVDAHPIVGIGDDASARHSRDSGPVPSSPGQGQADLQWQTEPWIEPEPAEDRGVALAVYAPVPAEMAMISTRVVDTRDIAMPERLDPRLVLLREPESPQAKSFRLLAHRVRHSGDPRVILVTSPRRAEGKTTCAVNLALALAEDGGSRVLLLEANGRSPTHARMFELEQVIGLPRQMARLETALVPWTAYELSGTRLSVMPSEEDGVVLGRNVFAAAIADMRSAYDYVIVDAPSALDSADVMALTDAVDAVVLCARAKKTRARELEKAAKQLAPAPLLGVVLLDVKEATGS